MTVVYVLRHPQTTWNATKRYQGRLESDVSALGRVEAARATKAFDGLTVDAVYSSPLQRARFLASQLQWTVGAPLFIDQRLTEMGQSIWEGLYLNEIQRLYPDLYTRWYTAPDTVRFPMGESLHDVSQRISSSFRDIFAKYPDGIVAVVTHAVVVQVLAALSIGVDFRHLHRIPADNSSISTFEGFDMPPKLSCLNAFEPNGHRVSTDGLIANLGELAS